MEQQAQLDVFRKNWGWIFVFGIVLIILGILAIGSPVATTLAVEDILGWIFIVVGVAQALNALSSWKRAGFILAILGAALSFVIGILLLTRPGSGALTLTMLLIVYFLVSGIGKIAVAIRLRNFPSWGWMLFNGIVSFVLALLILSQWPSSARWVIGLLVGVELLVSGLVMTVTGMTVRKVLKVDSPV